MACVFIVWTTLIFEPIYTVHQIVNDHCARDCAPDLYHQLNNFKSYSYIDYCFSMTSNSEEEKLKIYSLINFSTVSVPKKQTV
jgi:hypothetical protein